MCKDLSRNQDGAETQPYYMYWENLPVQMWCNTASLNQSYEWPAWLTRKVKITFILPHNFCVNTKITSPKNPSESLKPSSHWIQKRSLLVEIRQRRLLRAADWWFRYWWSYLLLLLYVYKRLLNSRHSSKGHSLNSLRVPGLVSNSHIPNPCVPATEPGTACPPQNI